MSLFFDLLSSINDPTTQGSVEQLRKAVTGIQQVSHENGIPESTMKDVVSNVGEILRPALKKQANLGNASALDEIITQVTSGTGGSGLDSVVNSVLTPEKINQISQKTGINASQLQQIVPLVLPFVLKMLNSGKPQTGVTGNNSLLNSFLDADRDGDVDLGDVLSLSQRFLR